ncbi:hypothetical protein GR925_25950 [Streptomyces sp. HUCO-GS316]|uniref:hypothetical protein n=1 Tax=Streptomyces sp. HUCO-GS316 TaxID=2692198 RepID=UPI0013FED9E9|nr:hypothetical protein [Streptomyces sp. HUCO-GS316]MXM66781.1 hypothetical protein [Streptomyces sp. HUCO-GS316]
MTAPRGRTAVYRLYAWLVAVAKRDRRSLNSEIVHRLEVGRDSVPADDQSP